MSGLIYGSLAVSVFGLIDTLHDLRHAEVEKTSDADVAGVMAWPLGPALVIALGAVHRRLRRWATPSAPSSTISARR